LAREFLSTTIHFFPMRETKKKAQIQFPKKSSFSPPHQKEISVTPNTTLLRPQPSASQSHPLFDLTSATAITQPTAIARTTSVRPSACHSHKPAKSHRPYDLSSTTAISQRKPSPVRPPTCHSHNPAKSHRPYDLSSTTALSQANHP